MTRIERFKKDVAAIEKEYGGFEEGKEVIIDLMEMAVLCPRAYSQKKSYQGLVAFIQRTKKATLTITSQVSGDGNENENLKTE